MARKVSTHVVGWRVFIPQKNAAGKPAAPTAISGLFTVHSAAVEFARLAGNGAYVKEITKHFID